MNQPMFCAKNGAISLGQPDANVWYSFVGDAVTFYGFTRNNNPTVDVTIDDVLVATETMDYDFTDSPIAFHYTGLGDGPHVLRINNTSNMRVDGFAANPTALVPYLPMVEWYDDTPAGNGAPFFGSLGMVSGMAAGDINNDGIVELVLALIPRRSGASCSSTGPMAATAATATRSCGPKTSAARRSIAP